MDRLTDNRSQFITSADAWSCGLLDAFGIDPDKATRVVITFEPDRLVRVDVTYQMFSHGIAETVRKHLSLVHVADADQQPT